MSRRIGRQPAGRGAAAGARRPAGAARRSPTSRSRPVRPSTSSARRATSRSSRSTGTRTYPTDRASCGSTTVRVTNPESELNLVRGARRLVRQRRRRAARTRRCTPRTSTDEQERAESAAQMVSSQDTAIAAALTELGYELPTYAEVIGVTPDGPSDGELEAAGPGPARRRRADRRRRRSVFDALERGRAGRHRRRSRYAARARSARVTDHHRTRPRTTPSRRLLGILVGTGYDFPFDVRVAHRRRRSAARARG